MKAKWIPSEQIVELQTPAVSTVSSSETHYQYTHPVISLCYYKMLVKLLYCVCANVLLRRESFGRRWAFLPTASSISSLKKLST